MKLVQLNKKQTLGDFNNNHVALENYVLEKINRDERTKIRNDWNAQYNIGEKDWYKYLLFRVNTKGLGKNKIVKF